MKDVLDSTNPKQPPSGRALVSVVVPALNEEDRIEETLRRVRAQEGPVETIVVDGGSTDRTVERAESLATRVLHAPRGRARQMNAGSARASGEVLVFLHADTLLPPGGLAAVRGALANPEILGGCFRLGFDRGGPMLRFYSFCTRFRWHRLVFGDRAVFVRRSVFEETPFKDMPLFEDLDFFHRLHRRGRVAYLPLFVETAARRFEKQGSVRQQLRNTLLWSLFHLGYPPERLVRFYPYLDPPGGSDR